MAVGCQQGEGRWWMEKVEEVITSGRAGEAGGCTVGISGDGSERNE